MKDKLRIWCDTAWKTVKEVPGDFFPDLHDRWEAHASRDHVLVTLFGTYDSGKSSLLKRLLVDDGKPIPDWLTVSGRRETFESKEVSIADLVVRDTPGIDGGNELHNTIANKALLLTDAVVLVLLPQIGLTGTDSRIGSTDTESIVSVFSGRRFGIAARYAFPKNSLLIVLSRMDEAGVMPRDDSQGYRELVERKRKELSDFLRSQGGVEDIVAVHAVAADPFGLIGNEQPNGREEYDADRSWDGIAGLTDFLQSLAARKDVLRQYAEVRFLGAEIGSICVGVEAMVLENKTATEAAANEATAHELFQDRLRALLGSARADLNRRIEEEVSAATRRGVADTQEFRKVILDRVQETLERWTNEHNAALEVLMREADAELQQRQARPAWKKLSKVFGDEKPMSVEPTGNEASQTVDKVQKGLKILHKIFREAQPVMIGMPIEKARKELQTLYQAGSFKKYANQAGKGMNRLQDAKHVAQVKIAVQIDNGLDLAIPAIIELWQLLSDIFAEKKANEQRRKRRQEVRHIIEEYVKKLSDRAWDLWLEEGMPHTLESALTNIKQSLDAVVNSLRYEGTRLDEMHKSLHKVLMELNDFKNS